MRQTQPQVLFSIVLFSSSILSFLSLCSLTLLISFCSFLAKCSCFSMANFSSGEWLADWRAPMWNWSRFENISPDLSSRYSHIQTMLTACCSQFRPPSSHLHFMRNIYPGQYFKTPFIEQNSTNKKLFIRKTYFSFFGEEALEFHNVSLWMSQSFRWR